MKNNSLQKLETSREEEEEKKSVCRLCEQGRGFFLILYEIQVLLHHRGNPSRDKRKKANR
jgi:hypothetical protein